jgi:hypothetical protein
MATLTISVSGSGIANANQSKAYTVTDADLQKLLNWGATIAAPGATTPQILLAWCNLLVNYTIRQITAKQVSDAAATAAAPPVIS